MKPTITAFAASPDRGRGQARDIRVRWALEEVGQPYDVRLVTFAELKQPAHIARHPFGQIPTYEEDDLCLFETGAIILHIATKHPSGLLLPPDDKARARAIAWIFCALNTIEPPILEREQCGFKEGDKPWHAERVVLMDDRIGVRLAQLAARLGSAEWLDGEFSAGDLVMVMVLRRLDADMIDEFPTLKAYVQRGEARPAFARAFADQLPVFEAARRQTKEG